MGLVRDGGGVGVHRSLFQQGKMDLTNRYLIILIVVALVVAIIERYFDDKLR